VPTACDTLEDTRLLASVAGGDRRALVALYERHRQPLFGYLVRLAGDWHIAEELLQDTLVAVWQAAGTFQSRSTVRSWLFGIARRQAHNRLRRRNPPAADLNEVTEPADDDPGPEDIALAQAEAAELAALVQRLGPLQQEILALVFVDDLSYAEIAQTLAIPVGTVKSRLAGAKRALAAQLATKEVAL